ncbi:MAG: hypothetical protein JST59_26350 [Actinobacteria bacterium]|nr:hypothetical protein [Actinomycetota bacterium]
MDDKRRRRLLGGMMAILAVLATAAMMWPGGGGPAPDGAQAFPGLTSIGEILKKAAQEERSEARKESTGPKAGNGKKGEGGKKATASAKQAGSGAAALSVAREFAQAFVVYEVGGEKKTFKAGFDATATAQLVKALLHRPPRQPADGKVPKAKVVNVVAGPSKGKVRQVSVSLLRVGVTSELRLDLERGVGKQWQVTNVLG